MDFLARRVDVHDVPVPGSRRRDVLHIDVEHHRLVEGDGLLQCWQQFVGGIDGDNVLQLKGTGIVGAAVVSGIFAQDDIETATKDLYNKIGEII